jgi:NAD+--asparagine ADP-ribosyltransferase
MMEQRAKLEGLTDRLATEENPINIHNLGKQSHRENRDNKLYNDLLNESNKKDDLENLMKNYP